MRVYEEGPGVDVGTDLEKAPKDVSRRYQFVCTCTCIHDLYMYTMQVLLVLGSMPYSVAVYIL